MPTPWSGSTCTVCVTDTCTLSSSNPDSPACCSAVTPSRAATFLPTSHTARQRRAVTPSGAVVTATVWCPCVAQRSAATSRRTIVASTSQVRSRARDRTPSWTSASALARRRRSAVLTRGCWSVDDAGLRRSVAFIGRGWRALRARAYASARDVDDRGARRALWTTASEVKARSLGSRHHLEPARAASERDLEVANPRAAPEVRCPSSTAGRPRPGGACRRGASAGSRRRSRR